MTEQQPWTVRRILESTIQYLTERGSESPRLDAEVLLAHARGCERIQLYTQYDDPLTEQQRSTMRTLVARRGKHEPVAYLVGHREFFSLDFKVTRDVFIPRPDTETLVMAALDVAKDWEQPRILDLCTGSGCVAVALAKNLKNAHLTAVELSPAAAAIARENIIRHEVADRVELVEGSLFEPIGADSQFEIIVSNPPYIPAAEIPTLPADVKDHEPRMALTEEGDGLDIIRQLIAESPLHLVPNGWLMFELSPEQADTAMDLMRNAGYTDVTSKPDLTGAPRVIVGRRT